jgi:lipopolysaccharide export system permease protein
MRLLDRYLFRELLTPLAYCLGGFLIFWITYDLFNELGEMQERKLHFLDVFAYSLAMTPEFLVTILPIVLLLALLYTLTNHARCNEITAMRAAGVGLWRICVPYFVVGLMASVVLFALNEFVVPHSTNWANQILNRYVSKSISKPSKKNPFGFQNDRAHRNWIFDEFRFQKAELIGNVQVSWILPNGSIRRLHADRAVRTNGVWIFFNAQEFSQSSTIANLIPFFQTNVLAMPEFNETPKEIRSEIAISDYLSLGSHKAKIPLKDVLDYLKLHPHLSRADKGRLLTDLHERLAAPLTCLVVVLIAIPFGAASGRRNLFVGVAGSISICFAYFVIQRISSAFGSGGTWTPWLAAWLPNLIFGATGLILTARMR